MQSQSAQDEHMDLRDKFRESVQGNRVSVDPMWDKQCLGYNLHALFKPNTQQLFHEVQAQVLETEPDSLYLCPSDTLHVSVAWILATLKTYPRDKQELWNDIKLQCARQLQEICCDMSPFLVTFQNLIATDSAVIAVATDDGSMNRLRNEITRRLPIPPETNNTARIIHTTLFRYRSALQQPNLFLNRVNNLQFSIQVNVEELHLRKELVYPSLRSEIESTAQLRGAHYGC